MASDWLEGEHWTPEKVCQSLDSGIVRLKPKTQRPFSASKIRARLASHKVVATSYGDGTIRLSMPRWQLSVQQLVTIKRALCSLQPRLEPQAADPRF